MKAKYSSYVPNNGKMLPRLNDLIELLNRVFIPDSWYVYISNQKSQKLWSLLKIRYAFCKCGEFGMCFMNSVAPLEYTITF